MLLFTPFFFVFASIVNAHFTLDYPDAVGDSLDNDAIPPCGGYVVHLEGTLHNFSIMGDWVQINTHHPESLFHYRAAYENNKTWIDLTPIVEEVGLGKLCIQTGPVPANFTGKKGVLQVVGDGHSGALFQVSSSFLVPQFLT